MIRAIERTRPIHEPGARTGYHGLTYGFLVGEILQRVTGEPFAELIRKELAEPLGLDGMYIGAPDRVLHRAAELIWSKSADRLRRVRVGSAMKRLGSVVGGASSLLGRGMGAVGIDMDLGSILDALAPRGIDSFDFGADETLRVAIPAINGLFTARALARMYAALAAGGEIGGVRLLSRQVLRRATERQRAAPGLAVLPFDMRWRLGYHGVITTRGFPSRAFGHFGFGGSGAWADPRRELAVAMTVNSGFGTPFGDTRLPRIGGAALVAALRRGGSRAVESRSRARRWTVLRPAVGRATDSES
jgi:CubicO group peptidase (beta-lactamase class C family)